MVHSPVHLQLEKWFMSHAFVRAQFPLGQCLILCFACLVPATSVWGAIFVPGDTVPGVTGDVFTWNRGDANSTFSGWDVFENVIAAVSNPSLAGIPFTDSTPDVPGQFGSPSSLSVGPGWLGVGSGNVYSPFVALSFSSAVQTGTGGGDFTRIVAQFRTGGSELDYGSILLSDTLGVAGNVAPSLMIETGRMPAGGFGGDQVDFLALWDLNSSQEAFRIDFNAASSSLSLQEFHLDTFTQGTTFLTPTMIPEPSSFAALGLLTSGMLIRRRRRRV